MNYKTLSCLLLAAALGVLSCNPTKSAQGGATPVPAATDPQMSAWNKNVDAYHEVMSLALLAKGSRDIANQVAKQESDEALTKAITALHDVFHEVVEMGGGH